MRRPLIVAAIVACGAVAAGIAYAAIPDSGGTIHACYEKSSGSLRVIDASATGCKSNEISLQWNAQGQPGILGPAGPKGDPGAAGPAGPAGPAGSARAYAEVFGGSQPSFNPQRTKGFTGITRFAPGGYCLNVDPSIDLSNVVALATVKINQEDISTGVDTCSNVNGDGIQVNVRNSTTGLGDDAVFYVMVP
jgi:hypothetical protein